MRRTPQPNERGLALLIALVLIAVLTGATLAMANLAAGDVEIAASDRMGTVARTMAETGLDDIMTHSLIAVPPGFGGFAPDPGDPVLNTPVTPAPPQVDGLFRGDVRYTRWGPVEESSALQVRSVVYSVAVDGHYVRNPGDPTSSLSRSNVSGEFYRIAPKSVGVVTRPRHYQ